MSLRCISILVFISVTFHGYAQLVTKKDYTAAFALQAGAESGVLMTSKISKFSQFKTLNKYSNTTSRLELDLEQIAVPVYAKYMLNSNRGMLLFGGYVSCLLSDNHSYCVNGESLSPEVSPASLKNGIKKWDYGFILGYEQLFTRHLALSFKINCGVQSLADLPDDKKCIPLKASLTLSYDLFRIGDCGCH